MTVSGEYKFRTGHSRGRFSGEEVGCGMCGAAEETLLHFLEECVVLGGVREKYGLFRARDVVSFGSGDWGQCESMFGGAVGS